MADSKYKVGDKIFPRIRAIRCVPDGILCEINHRFVWVGGETEVLDVECRHNPYTYDGTHNSIWMYLCVFPEQNIIGWVKEDDMTTEPLAKMPEALG